MSPRLVGQEWCPSLLVALELLYLLLDRLRASLSSSQAVLVVLKTYQMLNESRYGGEGKVVWVERASPLAQCLFRVQFLRVLLGSSHESKRKEARLYIAEEQE